jgi:2-dehydro-3-deoxygalactonokinase
MGHGMRWADGFIAVDWGTTNRRAYRIDESGACVDEFEDGKGALSVPRGEFPAAVAEIRERLGDHPMLLAGMAASTISSRILSGPTNGRRSCRACPMSARAAPT